MTNIFRVFLGVILLGMLVVSCSGGKRTGKPRVLIFTKTAGFRHTSIPNGIAAIQKLGLEKGFETDTTENPAYFHEDSLKKYAAVIFLHTTGDVLDHYQQADFERYIQAGGGYVGIHAAADCEYNWPWYGKLVGAYFKSHPKIQPARLLVNSKTHPSTAQLPDIWERADEWYNFRVVPADSLVRVLISIDEKSYEGGENGSNHPMAWFHDYDGGRAFYTELGHTEASFTEPLYLSHIAGGIEYAIGGNAELNYGKAYSLRVPEEDRFTKNMLATGFDEPTEMTILPNLDVLVVQRKGEILRYDAVSRQLTQIAKLNVYHKATVPDVNAEEGLMGIAADPDFKDNGYIYLYYSPADTSVNRLSRFRYQDGKLDLSSEKTVLELYSQRNICCHTGGSIAFGPRGNLYLSTGDNTTPFDQPTAFATHGYAPLDTRKGFEKYDAARSSGNANDLRGKILRMKILPDGSYTIPDDNLFPPGTSGTRPEIYVMGNRNPYRISLDRKTGFLYWGEVGPDAGADSLDTRGPRGYDELNQARKAGFFGWPFFVGNNYPYHPYDYTTGKTGPLFDPQNPVNNSPNNTGIKNLPPVSPAFIYYPYAQSAEFPELGTGGRNAMAGPVYYASYYPVETRMPDYYEGKLVFYDWMRGWIKMVTMDEEGNFQKLEPFMEHTRFNNPIDIEMGPDGRLYVLEYGSGWFLKNPDAGLSRIEFNGGNRAPIVKISIEKQTGALPFEVRASAAGSYDPDRDNLTYIWHFGKDKTLETEKPEASHIFTNAGDYPIYVEVRDDKGAGSKSAEILVYAGNETPELRIEFLPQTGFYLPGKPVSYRVIATDKEDGSSVNGGIDPKSIYVKADYISGSDKAQVVGHQVVSAITEGKNIVESLDCKSCHKQAEKSIGPDYVSVANRYAGKADAGGYLVNKIIKGGGGVWGETAMAAHPDLKPADAEKIVSWILSLAGQGVRPSLPASGRIIPASKDVGPGKWLQLTATYTDKGGSQVKPLTGVGFASLRGPMVGMDENKGMEKMSLFDYNGSKLAVLSGDSGWILFDDLNLKGVTRVDLAFGMQDPLVKGFVFEWRAESPVGTLLGQARIGPGGKPGFGSLSAPLTNTGDRARKLYLVVRKADPAETKVLAITSMTFRAGD
jgi:glucose/arabinose dehydrogenase/cytochrome c551/c552